MAGENQVLLPILHLPGGLHVVLGGFVEIDDSDQNAVVLRYTGGGLRKLSEEQSESFLLQVGLKQSRIDTAAAGSARFGARR